MKLPVPSGDGLAAGRPAPHGAGGLKFIPFRDVQAFTRPAPHGAGGLKFPVSVAAMSATIVPPRTGRVD